MTARRDYKPTEPDYAVGALLLDVAVKFADALAAGSDELANRWADAAFRVRGAGKYHDTNRDLHERHEAERRTSRHVD